MLKTRVMLSTACVSLLAITGGMGNTASADLIEPGFDLFETDPENTFVTLDFGFGPQMIFFMGDPQPIIDLEMGLSPFTTTDTIVERLTGIDPFDPPNGFGTVEIELVALSLVSVDPVDIGGTLFDVRVRGGSLLDHEPSPVGWMDVHHDDPSGGTFESWLPVLTTVRFTEVGDPDNTFDVKVFDELLGNSSWFHEEFSFDQHTDQLMAGQFYGDAVLDIGQIITHSVIPATPAPGTLALLALAGLAVRGRRRR